MSFSDLMSSGRGPGVIGTVIALIVLLGFGLLFTIAFDDTMQGADESIEFIIKKQGEEIETSKASVEEGNQKLAKAPGMLSDARTLADLRRETQNRTAEIAALQQSLEEAKAAVAAQTRVFEDYKDAYRAFVRGKAQGETLASLKIKSGKVYNNVSIREVTPVGMQIRHEEGFQRIGFEDLPAELQERFQFDPAQKKAALEREAAEALKHDSEVSAAQQQEEAQMAKQREKDAIADKKRAVEALAAMKASVIRMEREVLDLERAIVAEKRKPLSRAPAMQIQLNTKRRELSELKEDLNRLKAKP